MSDMSLLWHCRLRLLQLADDNKVANEQAKNALESHVFETKDAMYSEAVVNVSTEEQREVILAALTQAGDWLEDEGYFAETQVCINVCSVTEVERGGNKVSFAGIKMSKLN